MIVRLAFCMFVHLVLATLGIGIVWYLTKDVTALQPELQQRLFSHPEELQRIRADAAGHVLLWCALALAASFVIAGLWIALAERTKPLDDQGALSQRASWAGMLILVVVAAAVIGYRQIHSTGLDQVLAASVYALGGVATLIIVAVAYYGGTLVGVKRPMRPSVLFAPHF